MGSYLRHTLSALGFDSLCGKLKRGTLEEKYKRKYSWTTLTDQHANMGRLLGLEPTRAAFYYLINFLDYIRAKSASVCGALSAPLLRAIHGQVDPFEALQARRYAQCYDDDMYPNLQISILFRTAGSTIF